MLAHMLDNSSQRSEVIFGFIHSIQHQIAVGLPKAQRAIALPKGTFIYHKYALLVAPQRLRLRGRRTGRHCAKKRNTQPKEITIQLFHRQLKGF